MSRDVTPLALTALITIVVAGMAAFAGSDIADPSGPAPRTRRATEQRRPQPPHPEPADPVVEVARRYALAARTWTPATYKASWERQIELAGGRYRHVLMAKRPGRRELAALHKDHARSRVRVIRTTRDQRTRPPMARVLVTLDEATATGGQVIRGVTLSETRLRRYAGRWLVVGWTALPGGS